MKIPTKNIVTGIAAIFLFLALINGWPYDFFMILRFVVCAVSTYLAWLAYENKFEKWTWIFGLVAILFNPLIPIHLSRSTWEVIDVVTGIFFIFTIFTFKVTKR